MIRRLLGRDTADELYWVTQTGMAHSVGEYDARADEFTAPTTDRLNREVRIDLTTTDYVWTAEHDDRTVVFALTDGVRVHRYAPETLGVQHSELAPPDQILSDVASDLRDELEEEREKRREAEARADALEDELEELREVREAGARQALESLAFVAEAAAEQAGDAE